MSKNVPAAGLDRRLSVAPMMDRTDRHCRYFLRLLSRRTLLYTEMITTAAILRGNRERLLGFDAAERPLALQLGGSDPGELAECARIAEGLGYDEVNLNLGCPSARVQQRRLGACLMAEPELVARSVAAMVAAQRLPVTLKTRIGIDERDSYEELNAFVRRIAEAGCGSFAVHARKAWLSGLSPKENREVPPLAWETVHRLKRDNPTLEIVLNGGIRSLDEAERQLALVDGVMIGRAAYQDPYLLAEADRRIFGAVTPPPTRADVIEGLLAYVDRVLGRGVPLHAVTRHILGLYQAVPGAKAWRRTLSEEARRPAADGGTLAAAASSVLASLAAERAPTPHNQAAALDFSSAALA